MLNWLIAPISARPTALARIIVGVAAGLRALVAWPVLSKLADPGTLKAPYFDWYPEPTSGLVTVVLAVWVLTALLVALGWRVSLTAPLLGGVIAFVLLLDRQTYGNHLYLMVWILVLLTLADAGAALSVGRQERPVVRWPTLLLMMQVSIVYGFAGITKLNPDFLSGRILAGVLRDGVIPFPDSLRTPGLLSLVAVSAVGVELFLALLLWFPGLRPVAFVLGLGLHLSIVLVMPAPGELAVFALEMLALYPLFLSRGRLVVLWDTECLSCAIWVRRFHRYDVLGVVTSDTERTELESVTAQDVRTSLHLLHGAETTTGFAAITRVLEHLVPTLWLAPLLRLPGLRGLGERWYRWQARRRSCPVGQPREDPTVSSRGPL